MGLRQTWQENLCRGARLLQLLRRPSGQKGEVLTVFRKLLTNRNGKARGEDEEGGWLEKLGEEGRLSSRRDPAGA